MTSQRGSDVLLYIGDGAQTEVFTLVGGLLNMDFNFRSDLDQEDRMGVGVAGWQNIRSEFSERSVVINASGRFTATTAEESLRAAAFSNNITNFEIRFGNGDVLAGNFKISLYEREGSVKTAERFKVVLDSNGIVNYVVV